MYVFEINGTEVNPPNEAENMTFNLDRRGNLTLSEQSFVFNSDGAKLINDYIDQNGLFQTPSIEVKYNGKSYFKGKIDLQNVQRYGLREIEVSLLDENDLDFFNDILNSVSIPYLFDKGFIRANDFNTIQTQRNERDVYGAAIIALSIYTISDSLYRQAKDLFDNTTDASTSAIPLIFGIDPSKPINSVLKIVGFLIYVILTIIALIALIKQLIDLLVGNRTRKVLKFSTILNAGFKALGYTFTSRTLESDKNLCIAFGYEEDNYLPKVGSSNYFFGDFVRNFTTLINAEPKVVNQNVQIETWDKYANISTYKLESYFSDQDRALNVVQYNTDEATANYNITFLSDPTELNTGYSGLKSFLNARVFSQGQSTLKGIATVSLPFAIGVKKSDLSAIDKGVQGIAKIIDKISGGNSASKYYSRRTGQLLLSNDGYQIDKVFYISGKKINELTAKDVFDKWHRINLYDVNQWTIYEETTIPMNEIEFNKLKENTFFTTQDDNLGEIINLAYNPVMSTAQIQYRIKEIISPLSYELE